MIAINNLVR